MSWRGAAERRRDGGPLSRETYGTAAALVFGKVFFPALGAAAGTVAAIATFAVAFLARSLGAVLFGHLGDRLGRKRTLIVTLTLMGASTIAVGVLADEDEVGEVVAHYNLLSVPVVDDDGRLVGIVTVDDAIDTVLPNAWKKRLPRLFART